MRETKPMFSSRASFSSRPLAVSMSGGLQQGQALASDQRIGIGHRRDDARHTGGNQGLGARRRATVVAARLQRDIGGGAMGLVTGCMQGMHFGVRFAGFFVPAFADDPAIANQHTTDAGVGRQGRPQATLGELQGARHHAVINGGETPFFLGRGGNTSRMAREKASTSSKLR